MGKKKDFDYFDMFVQAVKFSCKSAAMLEETLRGALGARVQVKGDLEKGTITVSYYSRSDLERIFEVATNINPSEQ